MSAPRSALSLALALASLAWTAAPAAEPVRPDFTGIWTFYIPPGPRPAGAAGGGGFGGPPATLPYTPEGKNRVAEYQKLLGPERANPAAYCVDYGMPSMMENAGGYPIEFIQKPDQLTIIYEVEGEMRRVFMGERRIPPEKRIPTRQGYSIGHWEGQTLVVETTDLEDGQDQMMHPHSEDAKIVERFSLGTDDKGTKVLSYEMTMTDPVYYTEPVKTQKKWMPLVNGYIITYRCPDEFWLALLDARREQLKAGKPADAKMSDVYKAREAKE
jgi:hypothetical protein